MNRRAIAALILAVGVGMAAASDGGWLRKVPETERGRANPYAQDAGAAAAGSVLFADHCAKCHGDDAEGRHGRPSLRSERVTRATDGEIFWLLKNGSSWRGMPSWSSLPEPERWQIIAYLRGLPGDTTKESQR